MIDVMGGVSLDISAISLEWLRFLLRNAYLSCLLYHILMHLKPIFSQILA